MELTKEYSMQSRHPITAGASLCAVLVLVGFGTTTWGLEFPGPSPGQAKGQISTSSFILGNDVLSCVWNISEAKLRPLQVKDKLSGTTLGLQSAECFRIILGDDRTVNASGLQIVGRPKLTRLEPRPGACRSSEQFGGRQISIKLAFLGEGLDVEWRAILRDNSNYVRQQLRLCSRNEPIEVREIVLLQCSVPGAEVMGAVDGSPVVAGNMFFAYEHPMSRSQVLNADANSAPTRKEPVGTKKNSQQFRCSLPCTRALTPGEPLVQSAVIGVVPEGQLRRGFLYYIERERVHPYRPFLHYNSWYDIAFIEKQMEEWECREVVERVGQELIAGRKVPVDSFVFDCGWDDYKSLWRFHSGFPKGFAPLQAPARKYSSAVGTWISPWGGYGDAGEQRLKYGREQGFEIYNNRFSLSGAKYYARFREVCIEMVRKYAVNYFKFDGLGAGHRVTGAGKFGHDVEALLGLIVELRQLKPDLFINATIGSWPSPFWLWHADSIWRVGRDMGWHGKGPRRQQWITYRDKETYHNVVGRAPLFPLNSVMLHGVVFAQRGPKVLLDSEVDDLALVDEIRTFFASGTHLQELYITPDMMKPRDWDALAEAAKWSRNNTDVLVDTHWIGGDPAKREVYGWASWSKRKGILALRNPSGDPARIMLDIGAVFELPTGAAERYTLKSPWKEDADRPAIMISAGRRHTFELDAFEVLVFDATSSDQAIL